MIRLSRVMLRYNGWYGSLDEYTDPEEGDWSPRDAPEESISHMIVREHLPELIQEIIELRQTIDEMRRETGKS